MDWQRTPVERIPRRRFTPPFCPRQDCPSNNGKAFSWVRNGTFSRKCDRRIVQQYRCNTCNRYFSQQAFACTYYLKKPRLLPLIAAAQVSCCAARQIARAIGCSHTTVIHQANRIGRHALLFHSLSLNELAALTEALVFDHFESFQFCQEMAVGIGTAVGSASLFTYGLDPLPHKLGGKMTPGRTKRVKTLEDRYGPLPTGSYRDSVGRILNRLLSKVLPGDLLHMIADGKPEYQAAAKEYVQAGLMRMDVIPNPPRRRKHEPRRKEALDRDQSMFPVDLLHKLIRHCMANHKRETLAHGRRINAITLRLFVLIVWRNFIKDQSERRPRRKTPAMAIGLMDRFLNWKEVLSRRLLPWRQSLTEMELRLYSMRMETPAVGRNRYHDPVNAF